MKCLKALIVLLVLTQVSCQSIKTIFKSPDQAILYQNSIEEAMSPAPSKIYSD